ncbi:MAG: chemotaxis protein CheW [Ectothiorhodospiraceae bacterium]|nr:chemotaxis protein CheW [Chromatiales bacterium]MCP5153272.1 chemotaxis protein CheW [Ectothiorhodospiraceae bacterium]
MSSVSPSHRATPAPRPGTPMVVARVGRWWLAIPASQLRAVARVGALTALPGAAGWMRGLARADDTAVAVTDLVALATGRPAEMEDTARLLVVGDGTALLVEEVDGPAPSHAPESDLAEPPPGLPDGLRGRVRCAAREAWWLEPGTLLATPELDDAFAAEGGVRRPPTPTMSGSPRVDLP